MTGPVHFADALISRIRVLQQPLCVGLDPHLALVPPVFRRGSMAPNDPATVEAVGEFLETVIDRLQDRVAVVKPQLSLFEQLGPAGLLLLQRLVQRARNRGLLVILDGKRGDIGSSAEGYAQAYLEPGAPFEADALTVHPYLGLETLEPYLQRCQYGRGVFTLVKTSNPGSGDLQDLQVGDVPVYEQLARGLGHACAGLCGPQTGFSALGVVVGATYPEPALRVRAALPKALFLVPGFGAQGASAKEAVRGFIAGPRGLEGGVVNSSRGVLFPQLQAEDAAHWEQAFDGALAAAIDVLGQAVVA